VEKQAGGGQGSVLLFHEYRPKKKSCRIFARGFWPSRALRGNVPDLPGHDARRGHFLLRARSSAVKRCPAIACARDNPRRRTILGWHSMAAPLLSALQRAFQWRGLIADFAGADASGMESRRKNCFSAISRSTANSLVPWARSSLVNAQQRFRPGYLAK